MIVVIAAGVIWLALVATRRRVPMLIASAILVGAWLWSAPAQPALSKAAVLPQQSKGSCASLEAGMTLDAVKKHMGTPDETRTDEETRGPGATMLIYRNSRCAVHLLDERVEFVD
jgi:hypothetical protein